MKVEILNFIPNDKPNQIGYLDCKIHYSEEKSEIFRGLSLWKSKFGKTNISFGNVKRDEKWLPRYERTPYPQELFIEILKEFEAYAKLNLSFYPSLSADYASDQV